MIKYIRVANDLRLPPYSNTNNTIEVFESLQRNCPKGEIKQEQLPVFAYIANCINIPKEKI